MRPTSLTCYFWATLHTFPFICADIALCVNDYICLSSSWSWSPPSSSIWFIIVTSHLIFNVSPSSRLFHHQHHLLIVRCVRLFLWSLFNVFLTIFIIWATIYVFVLTNVFFCLMFREAGEATLLSNLYIDILLPLNSDSVSFQSLAYWQI